MELGSGLLSPGRQSTVVKSLYSARLPYQAGCHVVNGEDV